MCEKVGSGVKWVMVITVHYVNQYACGVSTFIALLVVFVLYFEIFDSLFSKFVNFTHLFQPFYSPLRGPEKLKYSV